MRSVHERYGIKFSLTTKVQGWQVKVQEPISCLTVQYSHFQALTFREDTYSTYQYTRCFLFLRESKATPSQ